MILLELLLFSSLIFHQVLALPRPQSEEEEEEEAPTTVPITAPRHCGIYKFKCADAAGACNNACYFINCVNGGNKRFTMGPNPPGVSNRVHSGCTTSAGKGLCIVSPFVQRFFDQQPYDPKVDALDCDEFPMNAMMQPAFNGPVRNSLRCIDRGENRVGGNYFRQFKNNQGDYKPGGKYGTDKTCDGTVNPGDTFDVEFVIDGDDGVPDVDNMVPYCKAQPDCANDGYQWHLSKLEFGDPPIQNGRLSQPYNYNTDNHYALTDPSATTKGPDIVTFKIKIQRVGPTNFANTVVQVDGTEETLKKFEKNEIKDGEFMEVDGLPQGMSLYVFSTGEPGTDVKFKYMKSGSDANGEVNFNGGGFEWTTTDTGKNGDYCEVWGVNYVGNTEQNIFCTFPALA